MKFLFFMGSAVDDLRDFPEEARRNAGFELDAVQRGKKILSWRHAAIDRLELEDAT